MLEKLVIKNVALIDAAEINFKKGLNVLSGETGSGKSVILESLNFVLGAKAEKSIIRNGTEECFVQVEFDVKNNENISLVYEEFDFDGEDTLLISRKLNVDGKSTVKVNGNTVTLSMLKKFTSCLVDVHGQSEHFELLKNSNQLTLIDKFGGSELDKIKKACSDSYSAYKSLLSKLSDIGGDEASRTIRLDILKFQIDEIEKADIKEGEETELSELKHKIINQEKIIGALQTVNASFSEEGGISDVLSNAVKALSGISGYSVEYSDLYERLSSAFSEIDDVSSTALSIAESFDSEGLDPDYVESRLELIKNLKKKYGNSYEKINAFLEKAKEEQYRLENIGEISEKLSKEIDVAKTRLYSDYLSLSDCRKKSAELLCENILDELKELGINKAKFFVRFNDRVSFEDCKFDSSNGIDKIEFMFSANLGEPVKPLSEVISGGEMSRFMLAVKVQTSKFNNISTFIFDEIDAGISGNIAKIVAEKFAKISANTQIIAISHLPQISAMADNNLLIIKSEKDGKTITTVKELNSEDKVAEIIRLVGGDIISSSAKTHSIEIIERANEYKAQLQKPN